MWCILPSKNSWHENHHDLNAISKHWGFPSSRYGLQSKVSFWPPSFHNSQEVDRFKLSLQPIYPSFFIKSDRYTNIPTYIFEGIFMNFACILGGVLSFTFFQCIPTSPCFDCHREYVPTNIHVKKKSSWVFLKSALPSFHRCFDFIFQQCILYLCRYLQITSQFLVSELWHVQLAFVDVFLYSLLWQCFVLLFCSPIL